MTDDQDDRQLRPDDIDASFAPRLRPGVTVLEVDDGLVLLHPETMSVHGLDRIGALIVGFLDGATTIDELAGDGRGTGPMSMA